MKVRILYLTRYLVAGLLAGMLAACGGGGSDAPADSGGTPGAGVGGAGANPNRTSLPKLYIATAGGAEVTSKDDYIDASVRVESEFASENIQADTEIRGRGNTTWGLPKKPYRLKFKQAVSLLGMPAERDWALLANYLDKSLVRSRLAMDLGVKLGMAYVPRSQFVELYVNDAYQGVYEVYEHVKTGANRVNVEKLDPDTDTDLAAITGGYLLEVDFRLDEDVCWFTSLNIPVCGKDPEFDEDDIQDPAHPSYAQYRYITDYLNRTEQAISTPGDSYEQLLNADEAAKWYLVSELTRNTDARMHSSVYLYKKRGGLLNFGPLWDHDLSSGNLLGNETPLGWYIRNSEWHSRMFDNTSFGQRVFAKWCAMQRDGTIAGLGAQVDALSARIGRPAIDRNFERWQILDSDLGGWNAFVGGSYDAEIGYLKQWLTDRTNWMDAEFKREFGACPA